jgi:3D (Asp-Asp-Asp) domain-containing protein
LGEMRRETFYVRTSFPAHLQGLTKGKYMRKSLRVFMSKIGIFLISRFIVIGVAFYLLLQQTRIDSALSDQTIQKAGIFTAYTASVAETDSTPTITASNQEVKNGIIANNCLPFGTRISVNGEIYEVQDRMHTRYGCDYFDIFMTNYSKAIDFGRQELEYELI